MIITLEHYFLWFLFYSFVGWMYESILVSCQQHRLVNRGFLNGPLCPIYGTGAILGVAILGNVHNPIIIFLISMVGATILEYTTSWVMEQLFHARWWDYSNFRFNLQGRVCLLGALIFGLGGVGVVLGSQPYVERVTDMIPLPMLHTLVTVLALITIIDLAVTVAGMLEFEQVLDSVSQVVQDVAARAGGTWQWGSSAVSDRMRESFRRIRLSVCAGPSMASSTHSRSVCSSPSRSSRCRIVRTSSTLCANLWARAARIRRFTESRGSAGVRHCRHVLRNLTVPNWAVLFTIR